MKVFTQAPTLNVNVVWLGAPADLDDEVKTLPREGFACCLPAGAEAKKSRDEEGGSGWERDAGEGFFEGLAEA